MNEAVISGTYSDLKFIKSRGVAQVVIEVPIEKAQDVVTAFGTPVQASDVWVAIARMRVEPKAKQELTEGERAKRQFEAMCQDHDFVEWFWSKAGRYERSKDYANCGSNREAIKKLMGIQSANDLLEDPSPWHRLYSEFQYRDVRK